MSQLQNCSKLSSLPLSEPAADMASSSSDEPSAKETPGAECPIYEEVTCLDRAEQNQRLAVEELIKTEASYVHTIELCVYDIRVHLRQKQVRARLKSPNGDVSHNGGNVLLVSD